MAGTIFSVASSYNSLVLRYWISAAFDALLPYCSGARPSSSSVFSCYYFQVSIVWIGCSLLGRKYSSSLWVIIYITLLCLFGKYPVHRVKLKRCQPISSISDSIASVLVTSGVTSYGPDDVFSLSCFTFLM